MCKRTKLIRNEERETRQKYDWQRQRNDKDGLTQPRRGATAVVRTPSKQSQIANTRQTKCASAGKAGEKKKETSKVVMQKGGKCRPKGVDKLQPWSEIAVVRRRDYRDTLVFKENPRIEKKKDQNSRRYTEDTSLRLATPGKRRRNKGRRVVRTDDE